MTFAALKCETCHRDAGERPIVSTRIDFVTGARSSVVRCQACNVATQQAVAIGSRAKEVARARKRGGEAVRRAARGG